MRFLILALALSASAIYAAETPPTDTPERETVTRSPATRVIPSAPMFRFEPKGDITTEELDRLKPYLSGKPLYAEDEKDLGTAMRHLREIK